MDQNSLGCSATASPCDIGFALIMLPEFSSVKKKVEEVKDREAEAHRTRAVILETRKINRRFSSRMR